MRVNIERIKKFLNMSDGLKNPSVFPQYLQSLDRELALKTCQKVPSVLIDFVNFLTERFGLEGSNANRYVKRESVRAQLVNYKNTFNQPAKAWRQNQAYLDLTSLPSKAQGIEVNRGLWTMQSNWRRKSFVESSLKIRKIMSSWSAWLASSSWGTRASRGRPITSDLNIMRCATAEDFTIPLKPPELIKKRP